jgi:hypothetical protein
MIGQRVHRRRRMLEQPVCTPLRGISLQPVSGH